MFFSGIPANQVSSFVQKDTASPIHFSCRGHLSAAGSRLRSQNDNEICQTHSRFQWRFKVWWITVFRCLHQKTKLWYMWPPMLWIVVTGRQLILSTLHNFNCPFHRDGHQFRICNPTNWPNSWDFLQRSVFTISLFSGPEIQNTPHGFRRS